MEADILCLLDHNCNVNEEEWCKYMESVQQLPATNDDILISMRPDIEMAASYMNTLHKTAQIAVLSVAIVVAVPSLHFVYILAYDFVYVVLIIVLTIQSSPPVLYLKQKELWTDTLFMRWFVGNCYLHFCFNALLVLWCSNQPSSQIFFDQVSSPMGIVIVTLPLSSFDCHLIFNERHRELAVLLATLLLYIPFAPTFVRLNLAARIVIDICVYVVAINMKCQQFSDTMQYWSTTINTNENTRRLNLMTQYHKITDSEHECVQVDTSSAQSMRTKICYHKLNLTDVDSE
jgi:hypothetical protein